MAERRRNRRVSPPTELVGLVKASIPARVVDLSVEGIQVELETPLRPAAECDLALPTESGDLKLRARVCRCRAVTLVPEGGGQGHMVYRAGLSFFALDDRERELIEDAIVGFTLSEAEGAEGADARPLKIQISRRFVGDKFDD